MGTPKQEIPSEADIRIIASDKSWIEGEAVHQLNTAAKLDDIRLAVGLPDLHPGKGLPIGAAFVSRELIYPSFIGNDIGCAMSFWQTDIKTKKLKLDRWSKKLRDLEAPWQGDETFSLDEWCSLNKLKDGLHHSAMGSIGGGNHFAELQQVDTIYDEQEFNALRLEKGACTLLVHSGSRALGQSIHRAIVKERGYTPYHQDSEEGKQYIEDHNEAVKWSEANRAMIAHRFVGQIGGGCELISDVPHNMITREQWQGEDAWIHRKGASTSRAHAIMIPGSRGTLSYLVKPIGEQDDNAWSLAHGAGRRWQRGYAKPRLSHKYKVGDLTRNQYGGHIICEDRELIYEEAPQAYKDIEQVINDLKQAGLIKIIASCRPLLTYKQRRDHD